MVLSLARESSPDGPHAPALHRWSNVAHTWSVLGPRMWRLLKRLQRWCCAVSGCMVQVGRRQVCRGRCEKLGGRYVAVVEQHAPWGPDGERWPHLNIVLHWPWLARIVQQSPRRLIPRGESRPPGRVLGRCKLLDTIVAAGWGYQSCAEAVDDKRKVASYLVKHAASVERTAGEVAKLSQTPVSAPHGFRRVRSGRGMLAPRFASCESTGALVRRDEHGNWFAVSRARDGVRTWVAHGPPTFRPRGETLWLDMKNRRVYTPEWSGWAALPSPLEDGELEQWVLTLDLRHPT